MTTSTGQYISSPSNPIRTKKKSSLNYVVAQHGYDHMFTLIGRDVVSANQDTLIEH